MRNFVIREKLPILQTYKYYIGLCIRVIYSLSNYSLSNPPEMGLLVFLLDW